MKTLKIIAASMALLPAATMFTACDNDMDPIYLQGTDGITLAGDMTDIVLSPDALNALVLTLYWNDNGSLSTSREDVAVPVNVTQNTIELSTDEAFTTVGEIAVSAGVFEHQFTCRDLNSELSKLGCEAGVKSPLYIRIRGNVAANMAPTYSQVLSLTVTPYYIDTTSGFYLNASKEDTGRTLFSAANNHVYTGFVGAGAWENWWLKEGDGTVWGNDGEVGTPFVISSKSSAWNFWYPGVSGCYYTVVNVPGNEWSALLIESLTVAGDLAGEMTYDRKANQWSLHLDGSHPATATISLTGAAKQYNVSTGTDDAAAIVTSVAFSGDAQALTFTPGAAAGTISVSLPAGECDLILDLTNPQAWTISGGTASAPAAAVADLLWVVGHNDGITGGWNWDSWLHLYNEDLLAYGGALNVNSLWGFRFYGDEGDWDNCWGMVEGGTGYEGKLEKGGNTNIAAPDPGLYVADVCLSALTYKLTLINSVSYAGLNDDWNPAPMNATSEPGVYTATVTKSATTPWGVKVLINNDWNCAFGGGNGVLRLHNDGFDGDNDLAPGTYTLTVNLIEGTYSYN